MSVDANASASAHAKPIAMNAPTPSSRREEGFMSVEQRAQRALHHRSRRGERGSLDRRLGMVAGVHGDQAAGESEYTSLDEALRIILAETDAGLKRRPVMPGIDAEHPAGLHPATEDRE